MDTLVKGLREQPIQCFSGQRHNGACPRFDDASDKKRQEKDEASQRHDNPAGLQAPGRQRHIQPGSDGEYRADDADAIGYRDQPHNSAHLLDRLGSPKRYQAQQLDTKANKNSNITTYM